MTAGPVSLAAGAARVRRHRRRQRQGVRHVVFVEIHAELLCALIENGWLDESEAENRTVNFSTRYVLAKRVHIITALGMS